MFLFTHFVLNVFFHTQYFIIFRITCLSVCPYLIYTFSHFFPNLINKERQQYTEINMYLLYKVRHSIITQC